MNTHSVLTFVATILLAGAGCRQSTSRADIQTQTLANGIRLMVIHFAGSTNVSIFSYLPMSLASDGPDQAQWSHLVEHLVIQSTVSGNLQIANAETLPDHMRLDFYGSTNNWRDGLSHHRRWLEGVPFTQKLLGAEKPKVNSECDYAVKNLATHKFAVAAWNQAHRHGKKNVQLKGNVQRAGLEEIQRYRDEHLAILDRVTVCIVGGVEPKCALAVVAKELGTIKSIAKPVAPVKRTSGNVDATWDLQAQHLLFTWPIPDFANEDYAALMAIAQWLNIQFFSDATLKEITGMVFAGADLTTPEGTYFYVSASFKASASAEDVRDKIKRHIEVVTSGEKQLNDVPMVAKQLSFSLTDVPDPAMVKAQAPAGMPSAMIEANLGLQLGMHEFRYGAGRSQLAQTLAKVTAADAKRAAQKYLGLEKLTICTIRRADMRQEP